MRKTKPNNNNTLTIKITIQINQPPPKKVDKPAAIKLILPTVKA